MWLLYTNKIKINICNYVNSLMKMDMDDTEEQIKEYKQNKISNIYRIQI